MNRADKIRLASVRHGEAYRIARSLQPRMIGVGEPTFHKMGSLAWTTYAGGMVDANSDARRAACARSNRLLRIALRLRAGVSK